MPDTFNAFWFLFTPVLTKNMSRHMKEKHNDSSVTGLQEKPVKCTICDQEFQSMRSVPRHMKKFHDKSAD